MEKILLVNACPRPMSRSLELAEHLLRRMETEYEEIKLFEDGPEALNWELLQQRDKLAEEKNFDHPMFRWARQFAAADTIVIAAPYWDLLFPAVLRAYLEAVSVSGLTFYYSDKGIPQSLCRAKKLIYVSTAGGFAGDNNFGFQYVKALAQNLFGVEQVHCLMAEGLDIWGADVAAIMEKAKLEAEKLI